jgi:hypothetical protein
MKQGMDKSMAIWKTIQEFNYTSVGECINKLTEDGYNVSEWITDIGNKLEVKNHNYPINLFRVKVSDFGFTGACKLKDIYKKFSNKGFNLVSPDIAILTRFLYDEQPNGEWLRIATPFNSMIDSDGVPHLPKLGKGLGMFFIETYWSYPDAIFHPHNEFIVSS